ncbi:MAG TPA: hypothetical protein VNT79_19220 [Phycisphaerae bacterium]|nr:hypothetical protein [Phycisphaerae bacterium]
MARCSLFIACLLATLPNMGCAGSIFGEITSWQPHGDAWEGITYYVGGAGPIGNIGSFDVPGGLRDAGYDGDVRVFTWQSWLHSGDQLNLGRNREKAMELAEMIRRNRRQYPRAAVNIIALSAGTGIATFALEFLPESAAVNNVVFLSCSMSSSYDLTRALRRVRGKLYVVHSKSDGVLKNLVWYTGTIDRSAGDEGIAGLDGFRLPRSAFGETRQQYAKLVNVRYRREFRMSDYQGGHVDSTARMFVRRYVAPALMGNDRRLRGHFEDSQFAEDIFEDPTGAASTGDDELYDDSDFGEYGGG